MDGGVALGDEGDDGDAAVTSHHWTRGVCHVQALRQHQFTFNTSIIKIII